MKRLPLLILSAVLMGAQAHSPVVSCGGTPPATSVPAPVPTSPVPTPPVPTPPVPTPSVPAQTNPDSPANPPSINQPWVLGNYPWYTKFDVAPADFPYDKVTHLSLGNVWPTSPTVCCTSTDPDFDAFVRDVIPRAHAKGKTVLLQLGGAGGNPDAVFNKATATDEGAAALAAEVVRYAQARGFDGVSLDWEEQVIEARQTALAAAIRTRWPHAVLNIDAGWAATDVSWASAAAAYVDRISPMTYVSVGNWGGWDGPWHQGALYETPGSHPASIDRTIQAYLAAGVPAAKLQFGIGFYGSGYGDSNGDGNCPSAPTAGWAGEWGAWMADYSLQLTTIEQFYEPSMTPHWDEVAHVPWLSAEAPGRGGEADGWPPKLCYITYENARSAAAKGQYLRANGLGGIIIWTVSQDHRPNNTYPVLDALRAAIG